MSLVIFNCKRCGKVFQKRLSEMCPDCITLEEEQFKQLYRTLQKSATQGGIAIEELSAQVGVPVEEIERFYWEGRLSTAATYLKTQCHACGVTVRELERKGRYCLKCSEQTANKAGVEIKSIRDLEKAEEEARKQEQMQALLKKQQASASTRYNAPGFERKFGSATRHRH